MMGTVHHAETLETILLKVVGIKLVSCPSQHNRCLFETDRFPGDDLIS